MIFTRVPSRRMRVPLLSFHQQPLKLRYPSLGIVEILPRRSQLDFLFHPLHFRLPPSHRRFRFSQFVVVNVVVLHRRSHFWSKSFLSGSPVHLRSGRSSSF